jgi:hypothetical protein
MRLLEDLLLLLFLQTLFPTQLNLLLDKFLILLECRLHNLLSVLSLFVHQSHTTIEMLLLLLTL